MIVVREDQDLLLITQPDHAAFSGELLAQWRAAPLPEDSHLPDLIFATREHDNGWIEADATPRWDAGRGLPVDFLHASPAERLEVWRRGTARFAVERPYAALLITRHALEVHHSYRGRPELAPLFELLRERERSLLAETGVAEDVLAAEYRLLDLADLISLAACNRWPDPFERHGLRGRYQDGVVGLDPFPLVAPMTFRIPCRRIPARAYAGDADLAAELAAAPWQELTVQVAAAHARQ